MNHDIEQCTGDNCPLKEDCLRYKAHKELDNLGIKQFFFDYCNSPYDSKTKTCKKLWKEK